MFRRRSRERRGNRIALKTASQHCSEVWSHGCARRAADTFLAPRGLFRRLHIPAIPAPSIGGPPILADFRHVIHRGSHFRGARARRKPACDHVEHVTHQFSTGAIEVSVRRAISPAKNNNRITHPDVARFPFFFL